jgi:Zn finger protein HypA/HybF involved in hydrogenase expression
MSNDLKEPTQLVAGMSHKEMLEIMAANNIFCGHDRFARILIDAQRRALAAQSLERMTQNAEELGLYDEPPCWCHECIKGKTTRGGFPLSGTRMILCPKCGNKRCPKASNHELECTGSNEPGQEGSVYTNNNTEKTA